jgi:hypothetical protein
MAGKAIVHLQIMAPPRIAYDYFSRTYYIVIGGSPEKTGFDHNPVKAILRMALRLNFVDSSLNT